MKRLNFLIVIVAILFVFQVSEFFTAPQSPADWFKSQIAMANVKSLVRDTYQAKGMDGVKDLADQSITMMGYGFTVFLYEVSDSSSKSTMAIVQLYQDPNEAQLAKGRIFYDKDKLRDAGPYFPQDAAITYYAYGEELRSSEIELRRMPLSRS
jgi:hypothetical protein